MPKSRYDEIHDKYHNILSSKAGTRYERLAALIFKKLDESNVVVHDLKMVGVDSGVKHQIDVTIESAGELKRVLIECKDFDISGDKVGLGIVRDFWGVVDDIHPDEAIIITCNGFTKDAQQYAKAKGIKLAIFREFHEEDWEGRIRTVSARIIIKDATEPIVHLGLNSQEDIEKFSNDLQKIGINSTDDWIEDGVYLNTTEGREPFKEFINRKWNEYPRDEVGPIELKMDLDDATIEVENFGSIKLNLVSLKFEIIHIEEDFGIISEKIAEVILEGYATDDLILFEDDLQRFQISDDGEVIT